MAEIVNKNPVNDPTQKPVKTHSTFRPNYSLYQSPIFGLNTPFFAMAGVGDDKISMRLNSDIDTFSLQAPSMAPLKRSTDYFMVPLRALLPNTSELIITNPLRGDDVDAPLVQCSIPNHTGYTNFQDFLNNLSTQFSTLSQPTAPSTDAEMGAWLASNFRFMQILSRFFSASSLVRNLGYDFRNLVYFDKLDANNVPEYFDFDDIFAVLIGYLRTHLNDQQGNARAITVNYWIPTLVNSSGQLTPAYKNLQKVYGVGVSSYGYHSLEELVYDLFNGDGLVQSVSTTLATFQTSGSWDNPYEVNGKYYAAHVHSYGEPKNILRVAAYQIACAEFYSVDTVDDVYSSALWRSNMLAWAYVVNSGIQRFKYNGIPIEYDAISAYYIDKMFYNLKSLLSRTSITSASHMNGFGYMVNLFSYTRSLRYQDYFVGSRPNPLAVGDVSVQVNSNLVDVVDVSKKIQVQRFLNQVNRVGRKFKEYVRGVLGGNPMPDAHEPIFLGHVVDTIGAEETQNTGAAQLTVPQTKTSNYRSNANRFAFTVQVPEAAIIIGIQNYDIPRVYGCVTDRENYHIDRYEAFNPFMQFVGDQEVFAEELVAGVSGNFSYQMRYAEYKQRVSQASGAFLGKLPGYAKVYDRTSFMRPNDSNVLTLGSDFIRANMADIDEFYLNRYVDSPKTAFHFIVRNDMEVTAHRPMAFAPSIL